MAYRQRYEVVEIWHERQQRTRFHVYDHLTRKSCYITANKGLAVTLAASWNDLCQWNRQPRAGGSSTWVIK